jgi:hypothetical protein
MLAALCACGGSSPAASADATEGTASTGVQLPISWPAARFPLSIAQNKRYLVDADGRPFLIQGDTAWSMIAELRREDVERYLSDRQARGFNTLLVNLIEHKFSRNAPRNAYGDAPFEVYGDFGSPNERYFDYADWILSRAEEKGFLVLLTPAYMGNGGHDEGWYQEIRRSGAAKFRQFGRYIATRFKSHRNILWIQGGDYNPPDKDLTRALVQGIREADPGAMQSAHCGPETAALDYWRGEPWLDVNTVYTYEPVDIAARRQYLRAERMPYFLIESHYENEYRSTPLQLRTQAFHALLNGATGQMFGNSPIWHFDGPGLFDGPPDWRRELASRGASSMSHIRSLFDGIDWWKLQPDVQRTLMVSGEGDGKWRAVAARAADGSFAIVYIPTRRAIEVDTGQLSGPRISARWYDPGNGTFSKVRSALFPARGIHRFARRMTSLGSRDQVLVLTSVN